MPVAEHPHTCLVALDERIARDSPGTQAPTEGGTDVPAAAAPRHIGNSVSTFSALALLERRRHGRWSAYYNGGNLPLAPYLPVHKVGWCCCVSSVCVLRVLVRLSQRAQPPSGTLPARAQGGLTVLCLTACMSWGV